MSENDFHLQISRELGGIQESLSSIHSEVKGVKEQMVISNGRTRKLEDWKLIVKTQTGVIAAVVSTVVGFIVWGINFFFK